MKISTYITLSLIILTICDDCSSKSESGSDCKGDCKWTAGTAASCAVATCTVQGEACKEGTTDCEYTAASGGNAATCTAKAGSCALTDDKTACNPTAGCKFTAAVAGKCAAVSNAFGLKTSLFAIFLIFLF